jgi:nicotinamide-nucleotide amidase
MEKLVKTLKEKNLTISSCESLTGGMFASSIVNVSGASSVFVGSYVTYMDKCKEILVNGKAILEKHGAISKEMAYKMASEVKEKLQSNIAVSFTGNAGPYASENKEVGLVYSCIIINENVYHYKDVYKGNREEIRNSCIIDAKNRILENL